MVSCNVVSKATVLSTGSLELLLRASVFALLDLNGTGGTTLPREVLGASFRKVVWAQLTSLVSCHRWLVLKFCLWLQLPLNTLPSTQNLSSTP